MRTIILLAGSAALVFALPAMAQAPQAGAPAAAGQGRIGGAGGQPITRVAGEVVSITDKEMTLRTADGNSTTMPLGTVMIAHEIPSNTIKAGDFVATTNITIDEKSGCATELRVLPRTTANSGATGESYPMDRPDKIMTNAPVAKVVDTPKGRVLTTRIPGGERQVILPPTVKVIGYTIVDNKTIKPGWYLTAIMRPGADGKLTPVQILTGENGARVPPPARGPAPVPACGS